MTKRKLDIGTLVLIVRGSYKGETAVVEKYSEQYDTYGLTIGFEKRTRWFSRFEIKAVK